jgi:hypothetical protein
MIDRDCEYTHMLEDMLNEFVMMIADSICESSSNIFRFR